MNQARDGFCQLPGRHFVDHWWVWVAVEGWPERAARFPECEHAVGVRRISHPFETACFIWCKVRSAD
ncbi:hypothetical protein ACGFY0_34035 [Streptomyces chartreusis]|uniref:hypothetical protein n=1 Tax=Streptomyces chartreusis TaxID=1969 RepID=UPI0037192B22